MQLPLKKLWDAWDLQAFVILSLSLQSFLILFAPLRKRTANICITMPLWSAYLLADATANFAIGLITNKLGDTSSHSVKNEDLLAFWAPFLLVHLGGQDTITSFALEDNELWPRHFIGLIFQCVAAMYAFFLSLPRNRFWIPTMLMFIAGIIKYAERTRALYLASSSGFQDSMLDPPNPGIDYAKIMERYFVKKEVELPKRIARIPEPNRRIKAVTEAPKGELSDIDVLKYATHYLHISKFSFTDLTLSFADRYETREFFLKRGAKDAFRVIEVELNFIYELLHTKVSVVRCKAGYICRFFYLVSVGVSLQQFYSLDKQGLNGFDVGITHVLLLGAVSLDIIAIFMLIFSYWTIIALSKYSPKSKIPTFLLRVKKPNMLFNQDSAKPRRCFLYLVQVLCRRWSQSMSTYNLIYQCRHPRSKPKEKLIGYLGLTYFLDGLKYSKRVAFPEGLRDFIFQELQTKSEVAEASETAKDICSGRGDWILRIKGFSHLIAYTVDVDYDESLLLWHIATELCYNEDTHHEDTVGSDTGEVKDAKDYRHISKLLSDYMIYLLVMQPTLMSAVAGIGKLRFRDTCAETRKFFRSIKPRRVRTDIFAVIKKFFCTSKSKLDEDQHRRSCMDILSVNTVVKPAFVKGDDSKSVLFDACILAKELKKLGTAKWEIISRVWVELLSYAACHCRANTHAQQLSKGGELITLVWILMAHLGLGYQFEIREGHELAKIIARK